MLQSAMRIFVARFASRPACCRARCEYLWRALRQDLHVAERDADVCGALRQDLQYVCTSTIACADNLQVSPLRMMIEPSCSGRDDTSGVVLPDSTLSVERLAQRIRS